MQYILRIEYGTFTAYQSEKSIEDLNEFMKDELLQIDDVEEIGRFENKESALNELDKYSSSLYFTQTQCKDIYSVDFKRYVVVPCADIYTETEVVVAPY